MGLHQVRARTGVGDSQADQAGSPAFQGLLDLLLGLGLGALQAEQHFQEGAPDFGEPVSRGQTADQLQDLLQGLRALLG